MFNMFLLDRKKRILIEILIEWVFTFYFSLSWKFIQTNNQVEFFNTLNTLCQFETMDYIKKLETSAMGYIIIGIIVFFMYCSYQIPIASIVATVFVGSEALAIFGVRKKKTIPIYLYIVLNILISLPYLLITCECVYN